MPYQILNDMEIRITTKQLLKVFYIIAWIIFAGVCIDAAGIIFATVYTLTINPANAKTFWPGNDLSALYAYDQGHLVAEATFMAIVAMMKVIMFYLIIKMLQDKKVSIRQPFSPASARFITLMAFLALGAGLFSNWGVKYTEWLMSKGVHMPDIHYLRLAGGDTWLFMAVTLFIIAQVFKRGIEIQTENELTV